MINKSIFLAALLVSCVLGFSALAQEPAQGPVLGSTGASVDSQGIRNYLLGPGDVLDVRVFGQSDLSSQVEVDADGNISSLPFLERPIRAQCRTDREVQKDIATAYAKYIKNPQVSVRVTERKSRQPATISGAVKLPSQVLMMRQVRLHELITKAGGVTDRASGTVQVMHTEPEMCPAEGGIFQNATLAEQGNFGMAIFKLSDLRLGKEEADPYIRPGDIVVITEGDPVYVTGSVNQPRELVIRDRLTLGRAIAMAGGLQRMAKDDVHIYRQKEGQAGQDDLKYNYKDIKQGKTPDVELKPFDIIEVGESSLFSGKGMSDLFKGMVRGVSGTVVTHGIIY